MWCLKFRFVLKLPLLYITYKKRFWFCCKELHAKQNWVVFGFNIEARADHTENKKHSPVVQDILIWLCSLENLFLLISACLSAGFPWSRRLKLFQGPKLFSSVLTKPRIQRPCVNTLWLSWIFKPHFAVWPKMEVDHNKKHMAENGISNWRRRMEIERKRAEESRKWKEKLNLGCSIMKKENNTLNSSGDLTWEPHRALFYDFSLLHLFPFAVISITC